MREIKFRFWNKDEKKVTKDLYVKWLSPSISQYSKYEYRNFGDVHHLQINDMLKNDKVYEIMQFTGIHDKNGKEIYEGDIVTVGAGKGFEVQWWKAKCKFNIDDIAQQYGIEVIGNIYENPDLLK